MATTRAHPLATQAIDDVCPADDADDRLRRGGDATGGDVRSSGEEGTTAGDERSVGDEGTTADGADDDVRHDDDVPGDDERDADAVLDDDDDDADALSDDDAGDEDSGGWCCAAASALNRTALSRRSCSSGMTVGRHALAMVALSPTSMRASRPSMKACDRRMSMTWS